VDLEKQPRPRRPRRNALPVTVGVISDTHGYLDPAALKHFAGVNHILHAGDIGYPSILLELEEIAPVTAVLGNTDAGLPYKETEVLDLGRRKFLLQHIVDPRNPDEVLRRRIQKANPDIVVFGHTHQRFCETLGGTLFFNPGYAGKPRFNQPRSIALLRCDAEGITADFIAL
jgi:putative phosphoesterase